MYKVIVSDMDGTLLKDDKSVSEETLALLRKLDEEGILFLPSTGRTHLEMPKAIRGQPFISYAICCNGGAVYDYRNQKYIYENAIPYETGLKLLEYIRDFPVFRTAVINGERICEGDEEGNIAEAITKRAVKDILFNFRGMPDFNKAFAERHADAQKFLFYLEKAEDKEKITADLQEHFPSLNISSSGPIFLEVNARGIDKGKALLRFCEYMDIDIADSVAFGDAANDLAMLDTAGLSIVMENADDETKKHADRICPSNNEDGVRKALEELFHIS